MKKIAPIDSFRSLQKKRREAIRKMPGWIVTGSYYGDLKKVFTACRLCKLRKEGKIPWKSGGPKVERIDA